MKLLWPGPALFVLFWLTLLAGGGSRFLRDPGMFWHTVCGDKILNEGFFDRDPFTFTRGGERWIPHQWLGEVAMAGVHRIGALDSLLVCAAAVVAGLFAWLAASLIRTGLHPIFAIAVTLIAVAAASTHFHVRPHLFTMVGMAVTMRAILAFEAGGIGSIKWNPASRRFLGRAGVPPVPTSTVPAQLQISICCGTGTGGTPALPKNRWDAGGSLRKLAWLIPFYWIWANTHGGMLGGMATLGFAFAGWSVWRALGWPSPIRSMRTVIGLSAVGIGCGLTAFLTPYGAGIVETWLFINNGMPRLPEIILEHARLDVADSRAWPLLAFAALYLIMLAGTFPNRPRVGWLLPLFWLVQACLRVRHGSLFAIVGIVALIDLWPHTRYALWLARKRPDVYEPKPPTSGTARGILVTACACVGLALLLQAARVPVPAIGTGCAKLDPTLWPTEALDDLKKQELISGIAGKKIFCEYIYGGYIEYHCPGYRVFVDDRCELFGDEWLVDFVNAENDGTAAAMERWEAQYGRFDFALTSNPSGYGDYFEKRPETWTMVTKTDRVRFFVRR